MRPVTMQQARAWCTGRCAHTLETQLAVLPASVSSCARLTTRARRACQVSIGTQLSVWFSRVPFFTGAVLVVCVANSLLTLMFSFQRFTAVCLQPYDVIFAAQGARRPAGPRCERRAPALGHLPPRRALRRRPRL